MGNSLSIIQFLLNPVVYMTIGLLTWISFVIYFRRPIKLMPVGLILIISTLLISRNNKVYASEGIFDEYTHNSITHNLTLAILILGLLAVSMIASSPEKQDNGLNGEMGHLFLFIILSTILTILTKELAISFLALELQTFVLYFVVGFRKSTAKLTEASIKFFTLSALVSVLFVLGLSLIYAETGTLQLENLNALLSGEDMNKHSLVVLGNVLCVTALIAKIGLVPFHGWFVDVYSAVSEMAVWIISILPKISYFYILSLFLVYIPQNDVVILLIKTEIVATVMIAGILTFMQQDLKRMIGYSIIYNNAFLVAVILSSSVTGMSIAIAFIITYALILGAIFSLMGIASLEHTTSLKQLWWYNEKIPTSYLWAVNMFALIGLPPFSFFIIKIMLLGTLTQNQLTLLAIVLSGVSVLAAYYYLRLIKIMSFKGANIQNSPTNPPEISKPQAYFIVTTTTLNIWLLLFPTVIDILRTTLL